MRAAFQLPVANDVKLLGDDAPFGDIAPPLTDALLAALGAARPRTAAHTAHAAPSSAAAALPTTLRHALARSVGAHNATERTFALPASHVFFDQQQIAATISATSPWTHEIALAAVVGGYLYALNHALVKQWIL